MTDADNAGDLVLYVNTPVETQSLLHSLVGFCPEDLFDMLMQRRKLQPGWTKVLEDAPDT